MVAWWVLSKLGHLKIIVKDPQYNENKNMSLPIFAFFKTYKLVEV